MKGRGCRDGADIVWHAGGGGRVQLSENMTVTVTVTTVHWMSQWNWMMLHVVPNVNGDMIRLELK